MRRVKLVRVEKEAEKLRVDGDAIAIDNYGVRVSRSAKRMDE